MNYKMDNQLKYKIPFPEAVNTMTKGQICGGKPCVAISSPTDITAALAAARDGYVYDKPSERKGVEIPRLKYPAQNHFWVLSIYIILEHTTISMLCVWKEANIQLKNFEYSEFYIELKYFG